MKKILPILTLAFMLSGLPVYRAHAMSFNDGVKTFVSYFKQDVVSLKDSLVGTVIKSKNASETKIGTVKTKATESKKNSSENNQEKAAEFVRIGKVIRCREVSRVNQNGVIIETWGDFVPASNCNPSGFVGQLDTNNASAFLFSKDLYFGLVRDGDVKKLQDFLRTEGYFTGKSDGTFGLKTRTAVRAYQKEYGIPSTGYVDVKTNEIVSSAFSLRKNQSSSCTLSLQSLPTPIAQSVAVGTNQFLFGQYKFTASGCTVNINTLQIAIAGSVVPQNIAASLGPISITDEAGAVLGNISLSSNQSSYIPEVSPFSVVPGTTKIIKLSANVVGGNGLTAKFGISTAIGTNAQTGGTVQYIPALGAQNYWGQLMTIGSIGKQSCTPQPYTGPGGGNSSYLANGVVSTAIPQPLNSIHAGNSGIKVLHFQLKGPWNSCETLKSVTVRHLGTGAASDIAKVYITDSAMNILTPSQSFAGNQSAVLTLTTPYVLPMNATKNFYVVINTKTGMTSIGSHQIAIYPDNDGSSDFVLSPLGHIVAGAENIISTSFTINP